MTAPVTPLLVIASHGVLSRAALDTARQILGALADAHAVCLEPSVALEEMEQEILRVLEADPDRPALLLVDLFGGSCSNVAARLIRRAATQGRKLRVIAGFNLAMLIEFAFSKDRFALDDLATRMIEAGRKACLDVNARYQGVQGS